MGGGGGFGQTPLYAGACISSVIVSIIHNDNSWAGLVNLYTAGSRIYILFMQLHITPLLQTLPAPLYLIILFL